MVINNFEMNELFIPGRDVLVLLDHREKDASESRHCHSAVGRVALADAHVKEAKPSSSSLHFIAHFVRVKAQ